LTSGINATPWLRPSSASGSRSSVERVFSGVETNSRSPHLQGGSQKVSSIKLINTKFKFVTGLINDEHLPKTCIRRPDLDENMRMKSTEDLS
jgi:hypothetical protein